MDLDFIDRNHGNLLKNAMNIFLAILTPANDHHTQITIAPDAGAPNAFANLFQAAYDVSENLNTSQRGATADNAAAPALLTDAELADYCRRLRAFFGPWRTLFCGKARSERARQRDALARRLVARCCPALGRRERRLAYAVARALRLCTRADLVRAADELADTREQHEQLLTLFLIELPLNVAHATRGSDDDYCVRPGDYQATVLIVDDLCDFVHWEMVVPELQVARCSSLALLFRLCERYADSVQPATGALRRPVRRGLVVSNPDQTLVLSGRRMRYIFERMRPDYHLLVGRAPEAGELNEQLRQADVYVYAGRLSKLSENGKIHSIRTYRKHTFIE